MPQNLSAASVWKSLSRARTPSEWEEARSRLSRVEAIDGFMESRHGEQTLLMKAAATGNDKAVALILEAGASIAERSWIPGEGRQTALFCAIARAESRKSSSSGRAAVIRRLIAAGADATDADVWAAACEQSADTALVLLESGKLPRSHRGTTIFDAVLLAISEDIESGHRQDWDAVFTRLVSLGANPAKAPRGDRSPPQRLRFHMEEEVCPVVKELWERHCLAAQISVVMPQGSSPPARRLRL